MTIVVYLLFSCRDWQLGRAWAPGDATPQLPTFYLIKHRVSILLSVETFTSATPIINPSNYVITIVKTVTCLIIMIDNDTIILD